MSERMLTPEELEELNRRIGANADKVIRRATRSLYSFSDSEAGRKPAFFHNCILPEMTQVLYADEDSWPLWLDDAVSGVARLDWYGPRAKQVPLAKKKIVQCFALLDRIDASTISHLLLLDERQSQRYYKACEMLHERLIDNWCDDEIRSLRDPAVFIYPREIPPLTDVREDS